MLPHEKAFFAGEISSAEYNKQEKAVHDALYIRGRKVLTIGAAVFLFVALMFLVLENWLGVELSFRWQIGAFLIPSAILAWGLMQVVMNKPLSNYD